MTEHAEMQDSDVLKCPENAHLSFVDGTHRRLGDPGNALL